MNINDKIITGKDNTFNLNYASRVDMFSNHAGKNIFDQLRFMYENGFRAFEDSKMLYRPVKEQEKIGELLNKLGMQMGVFVVGRGIGKGLQEAKKKGGINWNVSLTTGKQEFIDEFLDNCHKAIKAAKRCNAKWVTVIPGFYERNLPLGIQTSNVINAMRRASEIFEPHGMVMVLEPLSDTPELFLQTIDQAYLICKAVNNPSCKILYDIYHVQKNEGNLISKIDSCWDEIDYIQIGDNPGRNEPLTGEINFKNIFKYIYERGYNGLLGMEHGKSITGKKGEVALLKSYREVDNFQ